MYNGWGSIYWDSSVGDTAAWGLYLQQVGVADQPLVDEFTTNYIVGGENLCLAPSFDNYTSEMGAISGITSPSQGSAVFNGTSDYIEVPNDLIEWGNGVNSDNEYTIAAWVYSDNLTTTSQTPFTAGGYGAGVNNGANIHIKDSIIYIFNVDNAGLNYIGRSYTATIPENQWFYIVSTYTGSRSNSGFKMYLNGSRVDDGDFSSGPYTAASPTSANNIGRRPNNNNLYWDGNLANVAIWNRALTSDEINSVMWKQYQDLNTQEINGLQAWYSLDSTEVFDWYGYARNQGAVIEGRTCVDNALNALAQL